MALRLRARGPFSLARAAAFAEGFPGFSARTAGEELRLAWAVDGDWRTISARVRQPGARTVLAELDGDPPAGLARRARRDLERILCLDVDGAGFPARGGRDPVLGGLQRRYPGLRPVLFPTPYEAAAWAIMGRRVRMAQAAAVRRRLSEEHGERGAFPVPERLAALALPQRGLTERKVAQLNALGEAALEGRLDRTRLRSLKRENALGRLGELPGVGPFSAELILVRGAGDPDALPEHEPRVAQAIRAAYGLAGDADVGEVAERWRPYRSWAALLLRLWLDDDGP